MTFFVSKDCFFEKNYIRKKIMEDMLIAMVLYVLILFLIIKFPVAFLIIEFEPS